MKKSNLLRRVSLLTGLSDTDLEAVARIAEVREFRKGETLFSEAASGDTLFVVVKGRVKIFGRSVGGKSKTFAYLEPRDIFGEMALLEKSQRSASAKTLLPSRLMIIHRRDFQGLLRRRPLLMQALLRTLCARLRRADREIESLSFNNVLGRLAKILLDLSERYGEKTPAGSLVIKLPLSHQELAEMAGTAREMVTRILNRFRRTGCLTLERKIFTLTDPEKLRGWIN